MIAKAQLNQNNKSIRYLKGDATQPIGTGPRVIVHCCNDVGAWGKGFVLALSRRWKRPQTEYRNWYHLGRINGNPPFKLGQVQFVEVEPELWVANLLGQHDIHGRGSVPPIRYPAIKEGLAQVRKFAQARKGVSVHLPRIGAGLAGGDWKTISQIIEQELTAHDIPVTVYSLT